MDIFYILAFRFSVHVVHFRRCQHVVGPGRVRVPGYHLYWDIISALGVVLFGCLPLSRSICISVFSISDEVSMAETRVRYSLIYLQNNSRNSPNLIHSRSIVKMLSFLLIIALGLDFGPFLIHIYC